MIPKRLGVKKAKLIKNLEALQVLIESSKEKSYEQRQSSSTTVNAGENEFKRKANSS